MRVDDVERGRVEAERVGVADRELDVRDPGGGGLGPGRDQRLLDGVDADDPARRDGRARSMVMVPGPQPTSSRSCPGARWGRRYAAELAAVRQRCERRTLSWWPWV